MGLVDDRSPSRRHPGLVGIAVDEPGRDMLCPIPPPRVRVGEERHPGRESLEGAERYGVVPLGDPVEQTIHHRTDAVVDDELLEALGALEIEHARAGDCRLYTSPSPRDG